MKQKLGLVTREETTQKLNTAPKQKMAEQRDNDYLEEPHVMPLPSGRTHTSLGDGSSFATALPGDP